MYRNVSARPALLALAVACAISPTASFAQLEEVIVTAQKREQTVEDVGISITSFSEDEIRDLGLVEVTDVALLTPGVGQAGSFAGQSLTFAIRGVTQQDFAFHVEPPVAIYIDEGYLAANNAAGVGLFDIERIEVLKGPQGTLFGRNATGGLVSVSSRKPTTEVEGYVNAGYASYDNPRVEAAISGPIASNVQGRLAAMYESQDGWMENSNPAGDDLGGHDTYGVRAHLQFQPTSAVDVLLTGMYMDRDQSWGPYTTFPSQSILVNGIPDNIDSGAADVAPAFVSSPRSDVDNLIVNANQGRDDGGFFRTGSGTARIEADLGWAELTSVTDYKSTEFRLLLDNDAGPNNTITSISESDIETWSQELRLYKEFDRARLTTGFYYLNIDAKEVEAFQILYSLGGVATNAPTQLETDSTSLFGQVEFDLTDQWTLIAGLRATKEDKDYTYRADVHALNGSTNDAIADIGPVIVPGARTFQGSQDDWLWTWKLQAEYRPNDDMMFYFGYNRGTKAGSFNAPFAGGANPPDPQVPFGEERLDSYEGGAKITFMENRAQFSGALYYYDYADFQSFAFVNFSSRTTNVQADSFGAEADLRFVPNDAFDFRIGMAYTDFTVEDAELSNLALILSGPLSVNVDREPPFTSEFSAFAVGRYSVPLAGGRLTLQTDVNYNDGFNFSVTNFTQSESGSFTLVGARVSWLSPNEQWEVAFWGRNLTDERYKTVGFDGADALGWTQVGYNEPRWFGGSVRYSF